MTSLRLTILLSFALLATGCPSDIEPGIRNADPRAEITSHADGDQPEAGYRTFTGTAEDPDHEATELELTWLYDGAEACPPVMPDASGNTTCEIFLESGDRTVTLQVEDPLGGLGAAIVNLDVQPYGQPWAEITSPEAGGVYYSDQLIDLAGLVGDEADDASNLVTWWESSLDADLELESQPDGSGNVLGSSYLGEGDHQLSLWVLNTGGNTAYDAVTISVGPPNSAPTCDILEPESGHEVEAGEDVTFLGQVSDVDVSEDWLAVSWESDHDGLLGSSSPSSAGEVEFHTTDLSVGIHIVTMDVSDEVGATCSTFVSVTVRDCPDLWYADTDSDGYGDPDVSTTGCDIPSGYVAGSSDCDDSNAAVSPAATESCNDIDDDCDGDIDDADSSLDTSTASTWHTDADADGYGEAGSSSLACDQPSGTVADATDCDDADAAVNPSATEVCNGTDDDCDGATDDDDSSLDTSTATTWYTDADGDGFGNSSSTTLLCDQPTGTVADATDCDDASASTHPGADEYCDGVDTDCDGTTDEDDALDATTWYADSDGDGHGDPLTTDHSCTAASGYLADDTDCDDTSAASFPGADEFCDGVDTDCDGTVDEDDALDASTWYADGDGDGYGDPLIADLACTAPSGFGADDTDCDDTDASVFPAADEYCNSVDDDCDGMVDEDDAVDASDWYADSDGDGYGDAHDTDHACTAGSDEIADNTDCDDTDLDINPGADESCDGIDNDCDGLVDDADGSVFDAGTWYLDVDGDGYGVLGYATTSCTQPSGYAADSGDCDDGNAAQHPGADEWCNGDDDDCDGAMDEDDAVDASTWYADSDSDGYGDADATTSACSMPSGYTTDDTDCDDSDAGVNPTALEICGDGIDQDCDGDGLGCIFSGTVELADADARLIGEGALHEAGTSVAFVGDTNADGYDDIVVGADGTTNGTAYLVYGPVSGDLDLGSADIILDGPYSSTETGCWVAPAGDTNSDGYDDFMVGATHSSVNGTVYLLLGPATGYTGVSDAETKFTGASYNDYAGDAFAGGFDLNGDAESDFIVGALGAHDGADNPGKAYVVYGPVTGTISLADADVTVEGEANFDQTGCALDAGFDFDADGLADFIIGADFNDHGGTSAGAAYVFTSTRSGEISAGSGDLVLRGEVSGDLAGAAVASPGDVNNDGYDDVLVGARGHDTGGSSSGRAYLVYGPTSGSFSLGLSHATFDGAATQDSLGSAVSTAGDIDLDGQADVLVGASRAYSGPDSLGATYLFLGPVSGSLDTSDAQASFWGELADERAGASIAGNGDANGDGLLDILIGAPESDTVYESGGVAYLLYGIGM